MAKSKRRQKIKEDQKKARKLTARYLAGGGESNYARKRKYCIKNGVWGWEVLAPKPWKKSS